MTALPKKLRITARDYLALEANATYKSEFYQGEIFAMAGASPAHNRVKSNFEGELYLRLRGSPCRTASSDQRVLVSATGLYTYPDIVIVCGEPAYDPIDANTLINPRVLIEVLSPSTEHYDRTTKFDQYKQLESAREYLLVGQDEPRIDRFIKGDDGRWTHDSFVGLEASLSLASVDAKDINLADIYQGITFPEVESPSPTIPENK